MLESKEYEYNAAERLIRYVQKDETLAGQSAAQTEASYRYDPFGRRIAKTIKQGSQTKTTYYIYSEQGLMAETDEKGQMIKAYGFNPTTMQLGLWSTDPIWQAETPNGSLTDPKARYDWLHGPFGNAHIGDDKRRANQLEGHRRELWLNTNH